MMGIYRAFSATQSAVQLHYSSVEHIENMMKKKKKHSGRKSNDIQNCFYFFIFSVGFVDVAAVFMGLCPEILILAVFGACALCWSRLAVVVCFGK